MEKAKGKWTLEETEIHTWFERDRSHVELRDRASQRTIIEFWDEDVCAIVEDGFINARNWHASVVEYANYLEKGDQQ